MLCKVASPLGRDESQPADIDDFNPQYLNPRFTMFVARAGSSLRRGRWRSESGMEACGVADFGQLSASRAGYDSFQMS
jgi:hypothetical protein